MKDLNKALQELSMTLDLKFAIDSKGNLDLLLVLKKMIDLQLLPDDCIEKLKV